MDIKQLKLNGVAFYPKVGVDSIVNADGTASAVDTVVTQGSQNLVTSDAVYDAIGGVPTPTEPVQSDWNQTNPSALDYIKNKPVIPVVPTLATVATTGSYNDLLDKPTIPSGGASALSELNDVNTTGISDGKYLKYDGTAQKWVPASIAAGGGSVDKVKLDNVEYSPDANGVVTLPNLVKTIQWATETPGGTSRGLFTIGSDGLLEIRSNNIALMHPASGILLVEIPDYVWQVTQANWTETNSNNAGYIKNKPSLATVATSGNYNDLTNKPTIPQTCTKLTVNPASLLTYTYTNNGNSYTFKYFAIGLPIYNNKTLYKYPIDVNVQWFSGIAERYTGGSCKCVISGGVITDSQNREWGYKNMHCVDGYQAACPNARIAGYDVNQVDSLGLQWIWIPIGLSWSSDSIGIQADATITVTINGVYSSDIYTDSYNFGDNSPELNNIGKQLFLNN